MIKCGLVIQGVLPYSGGMRSFDGVVQHLAKTLNVPLDKVQAIAQELWTALQEEATRERQALVDAALDAVVAINTEGHVTNWNNQAEKLFGWTADEAIGKSLNELFIPERFREAHTKGLARFNETGKAHVLNRRLELNAINRQGVEFPLELTITKVRTSKGYYFNSFMRDLSGVKAKEEALKQELFESKLLHQATLLASEPEDVDKALKLCMETICRMANWPIGHVYLASANGNPRLIPTDIWQTDDVAINSEFQCATLQKEMTKGEGLPGRVWDSKKPVWIIDVTRDDNFPRKDMCSTLNIKGAFAFPIIVANEVYAVLEFFSYDKMTPNQPLVEITTNLGQQIGRIIERKRHIEEINKKSEALALANQSIEDLLSVVTHELKNPLMVIAGYAELLQDEYGDEAKEAIEIIRRNAEDQRLLLDDLTNLTQVRRGKLTIEKKTTDLAKIARACIQDAFIQAEKKGVKLSSEIEAEVSGQTDPVRIRQVINNLLSNAIKFTPQGGRVSLSLKKEPNGQRATLSVADTGRGIDAKYLNRVFDPYQQVKKKDAYIGTGLGLAIAKHIVDAHQGIIKVESRGTNKGSEFQIILPLQ